MKLQRVVRTREEAHAAITEAYAHAKLLIVDGKRVSITVEPEQELMTLRQRRFFHGPVLGQIADQAHDEDGTKYPRKVWKEFYREKFLGSRWEQLKLPGQAPKPFEVRVSTEDLSVREYSEHIERVIAHAVTELGVSFNLDQREHEATRWPPHNHPRQSAQPKEPATC